jgi:hypothetical protein
MKTMRGMGGGEHGGMMHAGHKHMEHGDMMQHHQGMQPMSAHSRSLTGSGLTRAPISPPSY